MRKFWDSEDLEKKQPLLYAFLKPSKNIEKEQKKQKRRQ